MIDRLKFNLKCLENLSDYIKANPELRFMQALWNKGLCEDRYYEEPDMTFKKVTNYAEDEE